MVPLSGSLKHLEIIYSPWDEKSIMYNGDYSRKTGSSLSRMLAALRNPILSTYSFLRKNPPVWNFLNRAGKKYYKECPPNLDLLQQKLVSELVKNGVTLTHLEELFPGQDVLLSLIKELKLRENDENVGKSKPFQKYSLGQGSMIDLESAFIQLSLQPRALEIASAYMGLYAKLIYFELATSNLLMNAGDAAMGSQRWHRDPGMNRIVKMFTYLTDVDEETGPFTYVLQSHEFGRWGKIFPQKQFGRHGFYPPDGAVEKKVPKSDIKVCVGKAGSVIFCDTTGLHRGGYAISKPRIMYTSAYMQEGQLIKSLYRYPSDFNERIKGLNAVSRFAVTRESKSTFIS